MRTKMKRQDKKTCMNPTMTKVIQESRSVLEYHQADDEARTIEHHHEDMHADLEHVMEALDRLADDENMADDVALSEVPGVKGGYQQRLATLRHGMRQLKQDLELHAYKEDEYLMPACLHLQELHRRRPQI